MAYVGSAPAGTVLAGVGSGSSANFTATPSVTSIQLTNPLLPQYGGTGHANNVLSTISISGAFPLTATLTASTSVTFPTSGTLATTAQLPSITATQYDVLVGGAANAVASVGPGSAGQVLQSGGNAANPAYSTATFPATAGSSGNVLKSDGTNWTSAAVPAIVTINGDSSSVTGSTVTFNGHSQAGATVNFSGSSTTMSFNVTDGNNNTAIGIKSGNGSGNALTGVNNTCLGFETGYSIGVGGNNTCIGMQSYLFGSGSSNLIIGVNQAGSNYTGNESGNLLICNTGVTSESNVTRIGASQSTCYIAGISGVTVTGTAVLCSTAGQLGTVASSIRYKENIQDIEDSVSVLHLRPRKFDYKKADKDQYGLIAEEIEEDFPYLCFYNKEGQPESVKYHELPVLLLKEIQRLEKRISKLEGR